MARTAWLVCIISTVSGGQPKSQKCLGRCGASSRHITKLEQSILFRYLWLVYKLQTCCFHFVVHRWHCKPIIVLAIWMGCPCQILINRHNNCYALIRSQTSQLLLVLHMWHCKSIYFTCLMGGLPMSVLHQPGSTQLREKLSTVDLRVPTSLDQLLLLLQMYFTFLQNEVS